MEENIYIYHTNDLHSHFAHWPGIRTALLSKRAEHEKNQESVFIFDIGDFLDRFHPYTEATLGKGNVSLLNESRYDGVTIGNNEGITLSHGDLSSLYDDANFPCIIANLFHIDGSRPEWTVPYKIYETVRHTKIGVIGVTFPYANFYKPLNWKVTDPIESLHYWIPFMKREADIIIVLSHMGLSDDKRIAEELPEVDVVLGGHTHHILARGEVINGCLLCAAGKYGQFLGEVKLVYDSEQARIINKTARLISTEELPGNEADRNYDKELTRIGKQMLEKPIVSLPHGLEVNWYRETNFSRLLSEALTEWCEADCSFINAGILLDSLHAGTVTEYDIHRICPHPINPCLVNVSGSELKEVLLQAIEDQYISLELKGFGFRGKIFGKIIFDRISCTGEGSAIDIRICGKKLDPKRQYKVATIDMFAFAKFFPALVRSEKKFFLPEFIRDVLKWKLASIYPYEEKR